MNRHASRRAAETRTARHSTPHLVERAPRGGFGQSLSGSLAAAVVLLAWVALLRGSSLGVVSLNPDESQFEAQASYLVGSGNSVFENPYVPIYTVAIYRSVAAWAGPYRMELIRLLVLGVSWGASWLVFSWVRSAAPWGFALLAGAVAAGWALFFEGLAANREWWSGIWLWLGLWLFLHGRTREEMVAIRAENRPGEGEKPARAWQAHDVWTFAAGLACGTSLWVKEQAVLLVLAIPIWLALDAAAHGTAAKGKWPSATRDALVYLAGGLAAAALCLAPLVWAGTIGEFFAFMNRFARAYALADKPPESATPGATLYFQAFYQAMPFRRLAGVGYFGGAMALVAIWPVATRWLRGVKPLSERAVKSQREVEMAERSALVALLTSPAFGVMAIEGLLALATVQLGKRFFPHYYLYLVPPLAALVGLSLAALWQARRVFPALLWCSGCWMMFDAVALASNVPGETLNLLLPATAGLSALGVGLAGIWLIQRETRRASAREVGALDRERTPSTGRARGQEQRMRDLALSRPRFDLATVAAIPLALAVAYDLGHLAFRAVSETRSAAISRLQVWNAPKLVGFLQGRAQPGDRLLVWGWRPEIYSLSRIEAATRFAIASYVMQDARRGQSREPVIDPVTSALLMEDVEARTPRFVVDAAAVSSSMSDASIYNLKNYPPLANVLARDYRRIARLDGCDVYERVEGSTGGTIR